MTPLRHIPILTLSGDNSRWRDGTTPSQASAFALAARGCSSLPARNGGSSHHYGWAGR